MTQRVRTLMEPMLREVVGQLPTPTRTAVGYQFGWWDDRGSPIDSAGGKGVRPALVVLSAEAVGGSAESAVHAAAAVELVHTFSLVHDDIMDGDTTRRHRPTVWASFGVPTAVLAGDALLALAVDLMVSARPEKAVPTTRALTRALLELTRGQNADEQFQDRAEVSQDEYMQMASGKTAALFGCACAVGAMCGGASAGVVQHLRQFGQHVGLAFQMVDDLLGIWGDEAVTGKPARSDLRSRKKTFPVVLALAADSAAGREFCVLYRQPGRLPDADLNLAAELIEQAGGRARTKAQAQHHLASALRCLRAANPVAAAAAELTTLAGLVVDRDH